MLRHLASVAARFAAFVLLGAHAGCFETGPLELGLTGEPTRPPDGDATGPAVPDTTTDDTPAIAPDGVDGIDASDGLDGIDTVDGSELETSDTAPGDGGDLDTNDATLTTETVPDGGDTVDTAEAEVTGPACLTDNDCLAGGSVDRCEGPVRCIDYVCRPNPAERVVCLGGGPCLEVACNPDTGLCEETNTCLCDPPRTLQCGVTESWRGGDAGARDNVAYACGPAPVAAKMRLFALPVSGRVRVSSGGDVPGLHVLSGPVCDGASCAAGAGQVLYFDAATATQYTLAAEDGASGQLGSVRADCDIITEGDCDDGLDDDGDGLTDCEARECNGIAGCFLPPEQETGLCGNEIDDDQDGSTDCSDGDCGDDSDCLERCALDGGEVYCNYQQGLSNGGGKARSTHYTCNPVPQTAKEMVFRVEAGSSGRIRVGFQGSEGLALHVLRDTGRGCTPRDCVTMATSDVFLDLVAGDIYYLSVDGPDATVANFSIEIDCLVE